MKLLTIPRNVRFKIDKINPMNQKIYRFKQDQPFNRIEKYFGNEWNKVLRDASFELLPLFRTMTRGRKEERERKSEIQEVKRVTLQDPPLCGGNCFLLSNGRKRKFQPRHSPSKRDALPFFTPLQPIQHLLFNYSTNKQTNKQTKKDNNVSIYTLLN